MPRPPRDSAAASAARLPPASPNVVMWASAGGGSRFGAAA
jgi:hypothetical protein